jgi:hypothetical protein
MSEVLSFPELEVNVIASAIDEFDIATKDLVNHARQFCLTGEQMSLENAEANSEFLVLNLKNVLAKIQKSDSSPVTKLQWGITVQQCQDRDIVATFNELVTDYSFKEVEFLSVATLIQDEKSQAPLDNLVRDIFANDVDAFEERIQSDILSLVSHSPYRPLPVTESYAAQIINDPFAAISSVGKVAIACAQFGLKSPAFIGHSATEIAKRIL